jgi:predicted RNA-binding protein
LDLRRVQLLTIELEQIAIRDCAHAGGARRVGEQHHLPEDRAFGRLRELDRFAVALGADLDRAARQYVKAAATIALSQDPSVRSHAHQREHVQHLREVFFGQEREQRNRQQTFREKHAVRVVARRDRLRVLRQQLLVARHAVEDAFVRGLVERRQRAPYAFADALRARRVQLCDFTQEHG